MRGKSLILLLLALGCGLVASIGITQVMAKRANDKPVVAEMEKIVVAIKDLPMGDPVNLEWVKLEDWPKDKVPVGAVTKLEDVEKRRPKSRVFSGSPVLDAQLFGRGETDNAVGSHIPPGYRVVSIEATGVTSSGGLIRPGDRVDLLLCVQANKGKNIHETSTRTILQDIKVFAVDGRYRLDSEDIDKVNPAKMVSLLLTPEQSQRVTLATELGTVRLAMRSPEDQLQPKVAPSGPSDLFGEGLGSRRNKESEPSTTAPVAKAAEKPEKSDDLLSFLRSQVDSTPAPTPPTPSRPGYNVRLISGTDVRDVRLEVASEGAASGNAGLGFQVWKPVSPALDSVSEPTAETKKAAGPEATKTPVVSPPKVKMPGALQPKAKKTPAPGAHPGEAQGNARPSEAKGTEPQEPAENTSAS